MKLHHLVVMVLVLSMIVLGASTYLNDLGANYNQTADLSGMQRTNTSLDRLRNITNETYDALDFSLQGDGSNVVGILGVPYKMIQIGWGVIRLTFSSFDILLAVIRDLPVALSVADISLPGWVIPTIVSIIMAIFVYMIIYMFFKWKIED